MLQFVVSIYVLALIGIVICVVGGGLQLYQSVFDIDIDFKGHRAEVSRMRRTGL